MCGGVPGVFSGEEDEPPLGEKTDGDEERRKSSQVEQIRSVGCRDGLGLNSVANWPVHLIYASIFYGYTLKEKSCFLLLR